MLNVKTNNVTSVPSQFKVLHHNSISSVDIVSNDNSQDIAFDITTSTDVVTDFLVNIESSLINIDLLLEDGIPKIMLRDSAISSSIIGSEQISAMWRIHQEKVLKQALISFKFAISNGVSVNKATSILPIGNTLIVASIRCNKKNLSDYIPSGNISPEAKEIIKHCQTVLSESGAKIL